MVNSYLKTTVPDGFVEAVLGQLNAFGVPVAEDDSFLIALAIDRAINTIFNDCNIHELPEGLFNVAVDMSCGEFMNILKNLNKLDIDGIDLSGSVTQIKEGDTSVTFDASTTDEAKVTAFIHHLLYDRKGELVCYRKIRW